MKCYAVRNIARGKTLAPRYETLAEAERAAQRLSEKFGRQVYLPCHQPMAASKVLGFGGKSQSHRDLIPETSRE